jgi:lysophospholipase L1-like esterase
MFLSTRSPLTLLLAAALGCGAPTAVLAQDAAVKPIPLFAPGTRVLFQGDSITDGNRGRTPDPNHILGHGYVFLIAARHGAAFPERKLEFLNRGISGHTTADLQQRWQADTLDLKPDVLSILVGANDSTKQVPIDQYERNYEQLLASAKAANPRIRLVLCQPFVFPGGRKLAQFAVWQEDIRQRQQVVTRLAAKYGAVIVDFQAALDAACQRAPLEHWVWDGVHPTYSGHQILADAWERAVAAVPTAQP